MKYCCKQSLTECTNDACKCSGNSVPTGSLLSDRATRRAKKNNYYYFASLEQSVLLPGEKIAGVIDLL